MDIEIIIKNIFSAKRNKRLYELCINKIIDCLNEAKIADFVNSGTYQFHQAVSYLAEVINDDGTLNIQYVKDKTNILKIQIQSRHISKKIYKCFIHYNPHIVGIAGIERYYCECANGLRTVGCCSHVAAVIYYLSHARFLAKLIRPAEILSKVFSDQAIVVVINDNSDED